MRALLLSLLSVSLGIALGAFSARSKPVTPTHLNIAAPPRASPKQSTPSDLLTGEGWAPKGPRTPSEFDLNRGRAIDTLRHDYPRLFLDRPDLSIFSTAVELHDPSGKRLKGMNQYEKVFDMLRFLRRATMQDAEITYRLVVHDDTIHVRWCAKMYMRDPALGLTGLNILDGVSVYDLDSVGKIKTHRLENIVMSDQNRMQSVSLGFAWPTPQMAMPEMAVPFFRTLSTAVDLSPALPTVPTLRADLSAGRRSPAPQASALSGDSSIGGETPMQKAERERAEDAEKARRLDELRSPRKQQGKSGFFGLDGPQECETSYDCDHPLVCCDLIVASVCCSGGLMIPQRADPVLQRQAIPVPVEKDSPFPPGVNSPPKYPNGY